MRKYLVGLVVSIAVAFAGFKIYSAYKASQPPFAVGECIGFSDENGINFEIKIMDNVQERQVSVVIVTVEQFGIEFSQAGAATYEDLRMIESEYKAKKVECRKYEENNQ